VFAVGVGPLSQDAGTIALLVQSLQRALRGLGVSVSVLISRLSLDQSSARVVVVVLWT
jgi:hypothetical protein